MQRFSKANSQVRQPLKSALLIVLSLGITACGSSSNSDEAGSTTPNPENPGPDDPTTAGQSAPVPDLAVRTAIGDVIVGGADNLSLYTFANDTENQSNCTGDCAQTWPPFTTPVAGEDEDFSTIVRDDQSLQWTVRGRPLYFYAGDAASGDISGEGLGDVWYVARPDSVGNATTDLGNTLVARRTINTGNGDPASRMDYDGRTLYVFDNDITGISNCNAECAAVWPPLYADEAPLPAPELNVIIRQDGTAQWAYQDHPLYLYAGDSEPGDTNGHGIGDVWFAAIVE